jgi:hypothetical protein
VNYAAVGLLAPADERIAYAFVLRLIGFVAILIGVLLKDRELRRSIGKLACCTLA